MDLELLFHNSSVQCVCLVGQMNRYIKLNRLCLPFNSSILIQISFQLKISFLERVFRTNNSTNGKKSSNPNHHCNLK
uniref:Uncharacterized protein n=1 Tax=Brassica oleracea var. oleracea TaxID=109376 RepID=A0A0D3B0Y0_BRAOL